VYYIVALKIQELLSRAINSLFAYNIIQG